MRSATQSTPSVNMAKREKSVMEGGSRLAKPVARSSRLRPLCPFERMAMAYWAPLPRVRIYGLASLVVIRRQAHFSVCHCFSAPVARQSTVAAAVIRSTLQSLYSPQGIAAMPSCITNATMPDHQTRSMPATPAARVVLGM